MNDIEELVLLHTRNQPRQSRWTDTRVYRVCGQKVRTVVSHDPYEFQAHYYAEVFDPEQLKWNRLHTASANEWYEKVHILWLDGRLNNERDVARHHQVALLHDHLACMAYGILS